MELHEVILALLVIAAIGGFQIHRYLKREKKELPIQQKIDSYRQSGQALMREEEIPLTDEERGLIRSRQVWMSVAMVIVLEAMLVGVACILTFSIDLDGYLVLTGFLLLSAGWLYWIIRTNAKQKQDVERGNKTIVRGIITKKYEDGDENSTYFVAVDTLEIIVKKSVYKQYNLGDAVEFHVFKPYQNLVLYHTKLKGAGLSDLIN